MDIADAQWRFDALGRLHRVDLKLAPGIDAARMRTAIAALLPSDAELVSQETEARRTDSLSRAYRVNLDMLALMALLTGAFLVYSAQSLSVARRRAQFALLRVLGVYRRGLIAQVLTEGAIVGAVGRHRRARDRARSRRCGLAPPGRRSRRRLFQRHAPAAHIRAVGGADVLRARRRRGPRRQPAPRTRSRARAARDRAEGRRRRRRSAKRGRTRGSRVGLLAAGTAAAFLPAVGELPLFGYLSIALLLAGGIAAMPLLARLLLTPLQRFGRLSASADLALKRLWGAPSQAAIALGGIVASTSLMIAMAVMVWSFRGSVDEWLVQVLPADIYLRLEGDSSLDADVQKKLLATPGVASINFRKMIPLRLSAERPAVILVAQTIDSDNPAKTLPIIGATFAAPPGTTAGLGVGTRDAALRLPSRRDDRPADRRARSGQAGAVLRRRHLARLRPAAGRDHDGRRRLHRAHRR